MPPNLSFDGTDFMEGATFNAMRVGYSVIKVSSYNCRPPLKLELFSDVAHVVKLGAGPRRRRGGGRWFQGAVAGPPIVLQNPEGAESHCATEPAKA